MKRILFVLVLMICISALADTATINGYTWTYRANYDGNTVRVTAITPNPQGHVEIPSVLGGKPVTVLWSNLFANCNELTSVTIPDSVRSIENSAFRKCSSLTNVTIPNGVTYISENTFEDCTGLTSVVIPDSVTRIGGWSFRGCSGLTSITIPDGVTNIGEYAFSGCNGLTSVTIGIGVTSVKNSAFSGCYALTSVHISNIGAWCGIDFSGPDANPVSNAHNFYWNGKRITTLTIPDGVTSIREYAFYGCCELTSVIIPNSVKNIGRYAFYNCNGMTNVTIPDSVTSIGNNAFYGCSGLTRVKIPDSVTNIEGRVFYNCSGMTDVTIPYSVTMIGESAFYGCSGLTSVIIPNSVTNIEDRAFYDCNGLTNVVISDSVMSIGDYAFRGCSGLMSFIVGSGNLRYTSVDGLLLSKDGETLIAGVNGNLTIPNGVTTIGKSAYYGCAGLTSLTIPDSVTSIGSGAFRGCTGLTSVTIPGNVTNIGAYAFYGCSELTSVVIPNSVTNIGGWAFLGCISLENVTIPNSVTSIETDAFYECRGLTNVMMPDSVMSIGVGAFRDCSGLTSVSIPGSVTNIGDTAFLGCSSLMSVTIPDNITRINYGAFCNCSSLTSVTIPNGVTRIEGWAFARCSSLMSITIPESVTDIANKVFYDCGNLMTIYCSKNYNGETVAFPDNATLLRYNPSPIVSFDANGGTVGQASTSVRWGKPYGGLPKPSREESSFEGWFYEGEFISEDSIVCALDDHVLLAIWKVNQYNITFDANGGVGGTCEKLDYDTALVAPNVSRTGYTFIEWLPSVAATVPANDVTYMAQWKINQYKVVFDDNSGEGGWSDSLDYGSSITPPAVSRGDYTFVGWCPEPDGTVPDHDVTYVAQWKIWDVTVASASSKIKELYPDDYQRITNIVIEASVASLQDNYFEGCDALEKVTFLSPDTELGNNDLRKVGKLFANQPDGYWIVQGVLLGYKGVCPREIPNLDAVKRVFDGALEGCTALEDLTFTAESVLTAMGTNAFKHCTELRQMTLPPNLTEIGDEAFMGCSYLGNVIVPGSVKKVGDRAFKNCTGFTAAQIEYGVESLGEEAFCGDWRISEVDIPSTVTNIGVNAFGGDSSIIRIGLRGDVRKASDIFSNYKFIREATVKEGAGEIVDGLFSGFEKLRDVRFFGNCPQLENDGQLLYAMTPGKSDDNAGLTTFVEANSTGWDGTPGSHSLPQAWPLGGGSRRAIAYWDVPSYLCQFESNGGTLGVQDTYQYSEKPFALPPEPVQSGYKFAGWWTKPVGGLPVTKDTIFIEGVYTMLYAHWIKGHWVFLDPNGGTVVNDYVTYVEETTYGVLPSPVRSGYAFNGWLYNDIVIEPTTVISDKNDHTIVAQWTANVYSVRYHANGGIGNMEDESRTYGTEKALRKNVFINNGYVFSGWATNETSSVIYSDCETVSNMTAVANGWIDLYAVWEESDVMPDPSNLEFHFSGDAMWTRCSEGVEVEKDGETLRYDSVWKSGGITDNQTSVLMANVYGAGKIGYWWKVSCESFRNLKLDYLEFAIDDVPQEPWINGVTDWQYLEFEVNETGPHTLSWTYKKDGEGDEGEDCGRVVAAVWTPSLVTLGDYVNCPRLEFRTSGGVEWAGDRQISHDGIASLRSGKIDHNGTTAVELDVMGEGRIGFWWKASSEAFRQIPIDYVSFKIDDVEQAWIGGDVDWTNVAFDVVGEGPHVLSWTYQKDGEGDEGEDCAWIDEVVWIPNVVSTVPEVSPEEAAAWVSNDLATRYAVSGEDAADYIGRFGAKFGDDPGAALSKTTGKKDAQGNDMYVWQDYVAGTDPTDTNSVFTATITMANGAPVVEWSPKLGAAEESRRRYTIYGKAGLGAGEEWHSPTNALDRFFTVGVEMR